MKLKQALIIGLSSATLALPAIAAESADHKDAKTIRPMTMTMEMPASKEAFHHHKKRHKKVSMEKKTNEHVKENAKLDELNALSESAGKDQTEKNQVKS